MSEFVHIGSVVALTRSHQTVQPPKETPGVYSTGNFKIRRSVALEENISLFDSFCNQNHEFYPERGGEDRGHGICGATGP